MNPSYTDKEPSRAEIDALDEPVLLEFGAPWCGVCAAAQPAIRAALGPHPGLRHLKVADGPGQPLGRSFGIKLWPTLVFINGGKEIERLVRPHGAAPIAAAIERLVAPTR
jgi:thioredoxin 1